MSTKSCSEAIQEREQAGEIVGNWLAELCAGCLAMWDAVWEEPRGAQTLGELRRQYPCTRGNMSAESDARYQDLRDRAKMDADLATIDDANAQGFMDCKAVRDGLGWDKPKANGSYYSSMEVAYRWIGRGRGVRLVPHPRGRAGLLHRRRTEEDFQGPAYGSLSRRIRPVSWPTRTLTRPVAYMTSGRSTWTTLSRPRRSTAPRRPSWIGTCTSRR